MMNGGFRVGEYSCWGYCVTGFGFPGRKGTSVLNSHLADFYGNGLLSINLYSYCVIPQESQLLYESLKGIKMTV
ncbi:hypothetical protein NK356_23855 [Chryseobacterium sp. S0630]|uniref:hypothetical protein n=1 Tax=Chryseobacterium sp. S0630 TaxID=2957803 RepID=UPI0020A03562|nr:hypothetical protein [Chryseobacterium sp. S0630]MCP1302215.1 hypothetical protein [Chryseobacterium sp. S0630]